MDISIKSHPGRSGDIVIDNQLHLRNIQPSARHIGRNEQLRLIRLEQRQGAQPLLLRLHAVQRRGNKAKLAKRPLQQLSCFTRLGEHHDGVVGFFSANVQHNLDEVAIFGLERRENKALVQLGDGGCVGDGGALPDVGIVGTGADGLVDEGGGGGGEEEGLAVRRYGGQDGRQLLVEST